MSGDLLILVTAEKYTVDRQLAYERREFETTVMQTASARGWARKTFNKWLRDAGRGQIVTVRYAANERMAEGMRPHGSGILSGVDGRQLLQDGVFER